MTPDEYDELAAQYTVGIDESRFSLAFLARQARTEKIPFWAERMAKLPKVRRAKRTIEEWARVADFIYSLPRRYDLPWSSFSSAARFSDKLDAAVIEEALEDAEAEEITVEALQVFLSDSSKPKPTPFCLEDELSELLIHVTAIRERADYIGDGRTMEMCDRDGQAMLQIQSQVKIQQAKLVTP